MFSFISQVINLIVGNKLAQHINWSNIKLILKNYIKIPSTLAKIETLVNPAKVENLPSE